MKKGFLRIFLGVFMLCLAGAYGLFEPIFTVQRGPSKAFAGALYVGSEGCLACHERKGKAFEKNIHSKVKYWDPAAKDCESCHGPGSAHVEDEGDPSKIINPAKLEGAAANIGCLSCHKGSIGQRYWKGSIHETRDVSCVPCHSVHKNNRKMLQTYLEADTCFTCHPEQRRSLFKRSKHPLRDASRRSGLGKMTCSSCHNPHGTQSEKLIAANSINDKCYECHQEKKAPVLWEHSAVKESCLYCHTPHGSNHEKMLVARQPRLCQQCHLQGRHQTLAGQPISFFVLNRGCTNCHAQIHGSNHPSGVKLKR